MTPDNDVPARAAIVVDGLAKSFDEVEAVRGVDFEVATGEVFGFLGPNGAGKSTTMRMILDLDAPTGGRVRVDGRRYRELRRPLREVGALLEAKAFHPGRSGRAHRPKK